MVMFSVPVRGCVSKYIFNWFLSCCYSLFSLSKCSFKYFICLILLHFPCHIYSNHLTSIKLSNYEQNANIYNLFNPRQG